MEEYLTRIISYLLIGLCIFSFFLPTIKKQKHSTLSTIYIFLKCVSLWPLAIFYALGGQFADDMEARRKRKNKEDAS